MELDVFSLKTGRKGISPLIATVLVILFGVTTLGIALGVVNPAFRRMKDTSIVNDEFHTLETLNTAIKEVASESDGSKRVVPVTITDGTLRVNSTYDWLYFEYEPSEAMDISGEKGDIRIEHGLEFADYFNYYADGSKAKPTWTNTSGQWIVSGGVYSGTNGTSYHNVSGPFENWKFSATISNVTGPTGGQVFVLPTNPESLVGFWPFDNRSGSVAYDYSGNRNNGTLTDMNTTGNSTSGWQDAANCKAGGSCLLFDCVNDYVDAGNNQALNITNAITVSAWVKFDYLDYAGNTGTLLGVAGKGHPDAVAPNGGWWFSYDNRNNGKSFVYTCLGNTAGGFSGGGNNFGGASYDYTFTTDRFYNIAFTATQTEARLYIDGAQWGQAKTLSNLNLSDTGRSLFVGRLSGGYYFNGTIDEVMIFNRSLSAAEILALYETSSKKLLATGTQTITAKTNVSVVLSNPAGRTKFDDVKVARDRNKLTILIPFTNVELNGTLRLTKGEHKIQIKHMETSTTTSRPIVELTAV